jgi:hypothetical protein
MNINLVFVSILYLHLMIKKHNFVLIKKLKKYCVIFLVQIKKKTEIKPFLQEFQIFVPKKNRETLLLKYGFYQQIIYIQYPNFLKI